MQLGDKLVNCAISIWQIDSSTLKKIISHTCLHIHTHESRLTWEIIKISLRDRVAYFSVY